MEHHGFLIQQKKYFVLHAPRQTGKTSMLLALMGAIMITLARQRNSATLLQNTYERSFRRVLEDIQLAGVTLDTQGRITFCNDHFLHLAGYHREDLLGLDWVNLMPNDDNRFIGRFDGINQVLPPVLKHRLVPITHLNTSGSFQIVFPACLPMIFT